MFGRNAVAALVEAVQHAGPWGAVLFGLAYVPAAVLFVPASLLTLAAGFIFGIAKATVIVSLGSTAGAAAAFLVARTVGHDWAVARVAAWPAVEAVGRAVESDAFKVVLLTRLSPLFPFTLLNYAFGLSPIPFRTYVLASWLGMMPGTILYIYIGSAAASVAAILSGERHPIYGEQVLFGIGLVATVAVITLVTRRARQALGAIVSSR